MDPATSYLVRFILSAIFTGVFAYLSFLNDLTLHVQILCRVMFVVGTSQTIADFREWRKWR